MLIAFEVKNFRSFGAQCELSYLASADRAHETTHCIPTDIKSLPRLTRAGVVFGPNASGKSNLIAALATLKDLVRNSSSLSDAQYAERYAPFRLGSSHHQPTQFTIDVLVDGVRHRYSAAFNAARVTHEQLLVYRTGKAQRWFQRSYDEATQNEDWSPFSPNFSGPREMWRRATRPKALFLSTAAQLNSAQLKPLFDWFEHGLEILKPEEIADPARIAAFVQDAPLKHRILRVLAAADIPIPDVRVAEEPGSKTHGRPRIEFMHARDKAVWLGASAQSAGSLKLFGVVGPMLRALESGRLLVIDDFDGGLHPILGRFLVRLVHEPGAGGAQALFTSHNVSLMDLDLLRRDEIWLAELDSRHATMLTPLSSHSPRKHEMVGKGYLRGRYGAIPYMRSGDSHVSDDVRGDEIDESDGFEVRERQRAAS